MPNKRISQLPLGVLTPNSIFAIVASGVTSQINFSQILSQVDANDTFVTGATYNPSNGTTTFRNNTGGTFNVSGYFTNSDDIYITGGTYNNGTTTFTNTTGGTFDVTGYFTGFTYTPENEANKQNSMDYDGSGILYPTVDTVNGLVNNVALATINTGFIDPTDQFVMTVIDDFTLGLSASTKGIFFKSLLETPPFAPASAILNIPETVIPLSGISFTGDGIYIKFIGYTDNNLVVYSNATFKGSHGTCQLGILILKVSGGTVSFLDVGRNVINLPSICSYSNLELTMLQLESSVIVRPNDGTMTISNTNGSIKGMSVNWQGANNDERPIASSTATSFTHLSEANALTTTPPTFMTAVTTDQYWNGSTLVNLSTSGSASIQRWIVTVNGTIALQYGEREYVDLATAVDSISIATFSDVIPVDTYVEITRMAAISGATNLSDTQQAVFRTTAGGGSGGDSNFTVWGTINGDIDDQVDLKNRLDSKATLFSASTNKIPKFTSASALTNSQITDNVNVLIGTTIDDTIGKLQVNGTITNSGGIISAGNIAATNRFQILNGVEIAQAMYWDGAVTVFRPMSNSAQVFSFRDVSQSIRPLEMNALSGTCYVNSTGFALSGGTINEKLQVNGNILATAIKKIGGTSGQYLMADGSISTGDTGNLFSAGTGLDSIVTKNSNSIASGILAFAEGEQTQALGEASHAEGTSTIATGSSSHAEGQSTKAYGPNGSHAEGFLTQALGSASHAEGRVTVASASYCHAEGQGSQAIGVVSHAEGDSTFALGAYSHTEGNSTTTDTGATYSHAEGYQSYVSAQAAHAEGNVTQALGNYSHAEGNTTIASGISSHAEGQLTRANGLNSHAEGYQSQATGDTSHAEGYNTLAGGITSHSEGRDTQSTGFYSHAEGNATSATTDSAHSQGYQTRATGSYSHAEGWNTSSTSTASHAEGKDTLASGGPSHAEGLATSATSLATHAEGFNTLASGQYSHAEGQNTRATQLATHAQGILTLAQGTASHAGGSGSTATGNFSFVHGTGSTASAAGSIVLGSGILAFGSNRTYVNDMVNKRTMGIPTASTHTTLGEDGSFTFQGSTFYWRDGTTWYRLTGATGTW